MLLLLRLQRGGEGQGCSWRDRAAVQSRARATYLSDVRVALTLSASDSAAAPVSPIEMSFRLLRGEEGQKCSWSHRAAESEHRDDSLEKSPPGLKLRDRVAHNFIRLFVQRFA
jgi:hypothetical protein